jgi:hypothetical protein
MNLCSNVIRLAYKRVITDASLIISFYIGYNLGACTERWRAYEQLGDIGCLVISGLGMPKLYNPNIIRHFSTYVCMMAKRIRDPGGQTNTNHQVLNKDLRQERFNQHI